MIRATAIRGMDFADPEDDDAIRAAIDDAEPRAQLPHGFSSRADGIYYDEGADAGPYRICGLLEILAQTRDERGSGWGVLLGWRDDDGKEHRWAMPRSMLAGDGSEVRAALLDRGLYLAPGMKARAKLLELLGGTRIETRARAVDRVGWCEGCFALPDRTIGGSSHVLYQGASAHDHPYLEAGTLDGWRDGVAALGVGNSRLAVAISGAFVGPVLDIIGEEGGGLNLRGPSSIGKSTALDAAASVWGKPSAFVRQWRATANGLEGVAVQHSETLLCLDELGQLDPKEAGSVAYLLANGAGKARASRSGGIRASARWRVFFLSSGEIGLADIAARDGRNAKRSPAGQEVRILDVEADAGRGYGLFETLHGDPTAERLSRRVKTAAGQCYGTAGPAFVRWLSARRDAQASYIRAGIEEFVAEHLPKDATGQVMRAARRFGLIAMAGELATRCNILPWPAGEASRAAAALFQAWIGARGGIGAAEDRDAILQVAAFISAHGGSRFEAVDRDPTFEGRTIVNRAGFWRMSGGQREHLIMADTWRTEVCSGLDARRVARLLAERGMVRTDGAGKNSISTVLPGIGRARVYIVTPAIFGGEE